MSNTDDYPYSQEVLALEQVLLNQILEYSKIGKNATDLLFPLEETLAIAFAKLGYSVVTKIFADEDYYASHSQISWLNPKEKGIYFLEDWINSTHKVIEYEIDEGIEKIKAKQAKEMALKFQKEVLEQAIIYQCTVMLKFCIFPELLPYVEKYFDVTSNLVKNRTFLIKRDI